MKKHKKLPSKGKDSAALFHFCIANSPFELVMYWMGYNMLNWVMNLLEIFYILLSGFQVSRGGFREKWET